MTRRRSWLCYALAALAIFVCGFVGIIYTRVDRQSWRDETQKADCIVVFGAAEYSGRPSPVWRARLDHAYTLFNGGVAPIVITTGGYGADPQFSEGGVGRSYLMSRGIPEQDLIAETQADNTDESVERVAAIMNANRMHSCVAVSDGYHIFRIKKMLERQGFVVYGSPRPQARPLSHWQHTTLVLREVVSYALWRMHIT